MQAHTETYRGWRIRHMPRKQPFQWLASPPEYMESEQDERLTGETRDDLIQEIDTAIAFFNATGGCLCGEMAE